MLGCMKHKLESRLLGKISITSDMQMTPPLWQKVKGPKKPLDESERGEWKSWLKAQHSENEDHGIWSHHFMANRWGNWKQWEILSSWAPKSLQMVTAAMKWWDQMPWSSLSECWTLSQLFHSPLSLSSRDFLVPFTFCHKGGVICISEVTDISPSNLDSSLCFLQPSVSYDVLCI